MMPESYGVGSTTMPVDDILGEGFPFLTQRVVLVGNSAGALKRGQVLGLQTATAAVAAKVSGTGDGDVAAATVTLGKFAQVGVYKLTCTAASTGAGTFQVQTPTGELLPPLTVAAAYAGDHINLTVPDGSADWLVGAIISVTVTGTGKAKAYAAASVDGSQNAALVLSHDVTVGTDDVAAVAFRTGVFNAAKLTGLDAAARAALAARSIYMA
jgi:hypothetical protein